MNCYDDVLIHRNNQSIKSNESPKTSTQMQEPTGITRQKKSIYQKKAPSQISKIDLSSDSAVIESEEEKELL